MAAAADMSTLPTLSSLGRSKLWRSLKLGLVGLSAIGYLNPCMATRPESYCWLSPGTLVPAAGRSLLYIACATEAKLAIFDMRIGTLVSHIPIDASPTGLVLSADGRRLYVTCAGPSSQVCVIDTATRKICANLHTGHTATAPVLSLDNQMLYVCDRFDNEVSVIDLQQQKEIRRIRVCPRRSHNAPKKQFPISYQ
jgi:YVTN family beta-propeller protein